MRNIAIMIFLSLTTGVYSQYQLKEIGLRGGYSGGVVFRVNLEEYLSYEAQAVYRDHGPIFGLVRQQHREVGMDRLGNWKLLHGFGAHAGFYFTDSYRILFREIYFGREMFSPVLGLDGYLAIEYQLVDAPVTFGISYQPYMEISLKQLFGINLWDFGFNVRYRF